MKQRVTIFLAFMALLAGCGVQADVEPTPSSSATGANTVIATDSKLLDTSGEVAMPDEGQAAPDFQFTMPDGTVTKLSDLRGTKVLVNFWATWCEPCRDEMPDLDRVRQEYGDDLVILAVNKAEKVERIQAFTDELPVGFALVANPAGDISQRYGTRTIPNSFFIDANGIIGARELKVMDYETIKRNIEALQ